MDGKLIEYVATTRMGERGTMTLPKEYRNQMDLEAGSPMTILRLGDALLLVPEQTRFNTLCDSIAARIEKAGVTETELQVTLPEVRESLVRKRYPELFEEASAKKRR
ncbi:MAG: AbrB/MazE/SpoVT family DNA-binding domain-containing protein [Bryobacteraceae bacterium]